MHISVIVPCFNAEQYLGEALDSIGVQGVDGIEVIVVDDGSTDASVDIALQHPLKPRVVRQENAGSAAARNAGIAASSGGLLAFLDADDVWTADSLAVRLLALQADESLDGTIGSVAGFLSDDLPSDAAARIAFRTEITQGGVPGTILLRRSAWDRVGAFDSTLRAGEFIDWFARAQSVGIRLGTVNAVVIRRRVHANNTTRGNAAELRADYLRLLRASIARQRTTPPSA